jgi:membrane-associated sensor protein
MDEAMASHAEMRTDSATLGWAGVWGGFTVLAIAAILSLAAWSETYPASGVFVSAVGAITAVAYLATAFLLSNRLVISRSPSLVLLAAAYIVCGLAIGAYTVTYPGVAPEWWPFGPVASRWFWVVWHVAAALGIIGFVALDDEWTSRRALDVPDAGARSVVTRVFLRDAGAFMRGPLLLAVLLSFSSAVWIWRDPSLFARWFGAAALTPGWVAALLFVWLTAIGLLGVALRRDSIVRAWLVLAAAASLADVISVSWSSGPSTIGWYFAQACGVVAAIVLPIVLLGDLRSRLLAGEARSALDPSLTDAQTGFANWHGLAIQLGRIAQLAALERSGLTVAVVEVADGSAAGEQLQRLFRASDVIGRTAENEFGIILTPGSKPSLGWLKRRLVDGETLRVGIAIVDPSGPRPVGDLLDEALAAARMNCRLLDAQSPPSEPIAV